MVKNLKLFNNFKGGNTRFVVTSERKFMSLINAGVTDSRLTYIKSLRVMQKPKINLGGNHLKAIAKKFWNNLFSK